MINLLYSKKLDNLSPEKVTILKQFLLFCKKKLDIKTEIKLYLIPKKNDFNITTGGYNINDKSIYIVFEGRQIADIMRTIAHELVHQKQDNNGELNGKIPDIGGIIEDTATAIAGRLIKLYVKVYDARKIYSL
jgi:hypothetical protein